MIPVALPSNAFLIIASFCLLATLAWIIWSIQLVFCAAGRKRFRGWRRLVFAALAATSIFTVSVIYSSYRFIAAVEAEQIARFRLKLDVEQSLGGISMPEGTELTLGIEQRPASFRKAVFPRPAIIHGVPTRIVERYLRIETDEDYEPIGFTMTSLRLTGKGSSQQEGWMCDAGAGIMFNTSPDGEIKSFERCTLTGSNAFEGGDLPAGSVIVSTQGAVYPDGRRGEDRWLIHLPQARSAPSPGTGHLDEFISLDAKRRLIGSSGADIHTN